MEPYVWVSLCAVSALAVPLARGGKLGWAEYRRRYLDGLERPEAQEAVAQVRALARKGTLSLLCGCPDEARCHRSLLRKYLLD